MKDFTQIIPKRAADLATLLSSQEGLTLLYAGGTDALARMKEGLISPEQVISIKNLKELTGIKENKTQVTIGAMTTLAELAAHPAVIAIPGLQQAALSISTPQLRNMGTVAGNLCQRPRCWYYRNRLFPCLRKGGEICYAVYGENKYHAILGGDPCFIVHPSDLAPMLIALNAAIAIVGPKGERVLSLEELYVTPAQDVLHETMLQPQEVITRIIVPKDSQLKSRYLKFRERQSFDFAMVSVAVAGRVNGDACSDLRIVFGGVAPKPWRALTAEKILRGKNLTTELLEQAGEAEMQEAVTLEKNSYKTILAKNLLNKVLREMIS